MVTALVLGACSSGKNSFEHGDYYGAVISSVNRLRKNSDHKKSVETLRQAYPMAVRFYEDRANTAIASAQSFKWSEVVNAYTTINNMYDEIKRCPGALRVIPDPVNYFSKLQEARQNAAEENYAAGITALQFNDREKAKQAYAFFKTAHAFVPGYKDVTNYLEAALSAATVKVLVEPIPVHSKSVGVSATFFNDKISEFVHAAPISEFVKFYTREEAETIKLNPDHIIQLQFDDFTVGQVFRHEKEIQLTKDSVVMGSYVTPAVAAATPTRTVPDSKTGLIAARTPAVTASSPVATQSASEAVADAREAQAAQERTEREKAATEAQRDLNAKQAEQLAAEKALADKLAAEKAAAERARASAEAAKAQAEKEAEQARAEQALAEKQRVEQERIQREAAEKVRIEKERIEKERIEKERIEKERAEKERAEREAADRAAEAKRQAQQAEANAAAYADPTIKSTDTLNVKDPVTICHIPPGNHMNARTLVISRSALKAHLAHGDMEGDCSAGNKALKKSSDKEPQKEKKQEQPEKQAAPKGKDGQKGKGPGAQNDGGSHPSGSTAQSFLQIADPVFYASAARDPQQFVRYAEFVTAVSDTNKIYGTVKATLYQTKKSTTAKGIVSFRIVDAKTGALLTAEKMPGEYVWVSEWATFNGDERALSAEQLSLTRLKEQPAPQPQELFIEFTRPIYEQITTKIRDFYKGY